MGRLIMVTLASALLASCSAAAEPKPFPYFDKEGGRVRDLAQVLPPALEARQTGDLDSAEENYGPQMAVVTVPSLHGISIEDFSLSYARAWKLGDKTRNDGIMLLVAPTERKVRIEVGKGIEGTFTDVYCKDVLEKAILPRFKSGDIAADVAAGVDALVANMRRHPTIPANDDATSLHTAKAA
jgi:uncharacterized protein